MASTTEALWRDRVSESDETEAWRYQQFPAGETAVSSTIRSGNNCVCVQSLSQSLCPFLSSIHHSPSSPAAACSAAPPPACRQTPAAASSWWTRSPWWPARTSASTLHLPQQPVRSYSLRWQTRLAESEEQNFGNFWHFSFEKRSPVPCIVINQWAQWVQYTVSVCITPLRTRPTNNIQ